MGKVIYVESPTKAPKIAQMSGMRCLATRGHFGDLPAKCLGIDLNTYEPTWEFDTERVRMIRESARGNEIYLAADPDREGFAIATMVHMQLAGLNTSKVHRLEIHAITPEGMQRAFKDATPWADANHNIFGAFLARREIDRLIGYILSPAATAHFQAKGYSVGRLQSATLRFIVDRELEIQNFQPKCFWHVRLVVTVQGSDQSFTVEHIAGKFESAEQARQLVAKLGQMPLQGVVESVSTKPRTRRPPAPFTLSTVIQAAIARLEMNTESINATLQGLFEAGYITYPRTDSVRIVPEAIEEIRAVISQAFGASALPETPNEHVSKASQADAHEAIRPTHPVLPAKLPALFEEMQGKGLGKAHCNLFDLIYRRTLASQMRAALYDQTTVQALFAGEPFKAIGSVLKEPGFLRVYDSEEEKSEGSQTENEQRLPVLSEGNALMAQNIETPEGKTNPPARYTEGTLIKALESSGIGRPSTYGSAVKIIKTRDYVEIGTSGKLKGKILPLEKGKALIGFLLEFHAWVIDYELTRKMEEQLDQVQAGQLEWKAVVKEIHGRLGFADPDKTPRPAFAYPAAESLGQCPICKGAVHEKKDFYGCSNYPAEKGGCRFVIWKKTLGTTITEGQAKTLLEGKQTRKLKLLNRERKPFEARLGIENGKLRPFFEAKG